MINSAGTIMLRVLLDNEVMNPLSCCTAFTGICKTNEWIFIRFYRACNAVLRAIERQYSFGHFSFFIVKYDIESILIYCVLETKFLKSLFDANLLY